MITVKTIRETGVYLVVFTFTHFPNLHAMRVTLVVRTIVMAVP